MLIVGDICHFQLLTIKYHKAINHHLSKKNLVVQMYYLHIKNLYRKEGISYRD